MKGTHCDADGCETWSTSARVHGFLRVYWLGRRHDFCSVDCMLRAMSALPPMEVS